MPKLSVNLSENTFRKLMKMKMDNKLGGKPWGEFFIFITRNVSINDSISEAISRSTKEGLGKLWAENFTMNLPAIVSDDYDYVFKDYPEKKESASIGMLPKAEGKPALIIAAGPSIREKKHIELLAERGWKGISLTTDRMLVPLLKAGFTPTHVMSVDGNRELIVKMFDDPIVDKYADKITGLFCSTSAPNAVQRFKKAGGRLHWFHGMMDNFWVEQDSVSSWMNYMTGSTCISAGGNVGSTGYTIAYYMKCSPICFIGLDYGYTPDTPIEKTAYYERLAKPGLPMEAILGFYTTGYNPDFGVNYRTDVVFQHYKTALFEMIASAKTETYNATEGGAVHGPGVKGIKFSELLDKYGER